MTPITKNGNSEEKRTVCVTNADGETVGFTYPKRAVGLVKKGRAQFVNDFNIRLFASDVSKNTEEIKMDNKENIITETEFKENRLYFNAREWSLNKSVDTNVGYRTFLNGPDGVLSEAFIIGDWQWNWTEIGSPVLMLEKNTLYKFVFWLNGGENDQSNETCQFAVIFNNDYDNRLIYNLNRSYIKPLKKLNGWLLYEIPFMTGDNEYTQLRFSAMRAYMTVLHAEEPSAYADIPDTVDEFESVRPQRHNIVFNDGWPLNVWYSTANLKSGKNRADADDEQDLNDMQDAIEIATDEFEAEVDELIEALCNGQIDNEIHSKLHRELRDKLNSKLEKIRKSFS